MRKYLALTIVLCFVASLVNLEVVHAPPSPSKRSGALITYRSLSGARENVPKIRSYDGVLWGEETELPSAGSPVRWVRVAYCPLPARENEKIVAVLCDDAYLDVYIWTGTTWLVWNNFASVGSLQAVAKCFDVAYEQSSGRAILVWATSTPRRFRYRIWDGSSWSTVSDYDTTTSAGYFRYMQMASKPNSNEIALVATLSGENSIGLIWSGSTWTNEVQLWHDTENPERQPAAVAYESQSGYAMFVVGEATDNLRYRRWLGTGWEGDNSIQLVVPAMDGTAYNLVLKSDPKSNNLMLGILDGAEDLNTALWNGSAWEVHTEHTASLENDDLRSFDLEWEPSGSRCLLVYDDTAPSNIKYKIWEPSSGWSAASSVEAYGGDSWIQLRRNPNWKPDEVRILGARLNSEFKLGALVWDGSSLTNLGDAFFSSNTGTNLYECFELEFEEVPTQPYYNQQIVSGLASVSSAPYAPTVESLIVSEREWTPYIWQTITLVVRDVGMDLRTVKVTMYEKSLRPGIWVFSEENWKSLPPWPGLLTNAAACYAENIKSGKKYVYAHDTRHLYRYSIIDNLWENLGPIPTQAFAGSGMVWTKDNYIYMNRGGSGAPNFWRYHIPENRWENLADIPMTQATGSCIAWDGGNKIYGIFQASTDNALYVFSISENSWTRLFSIVYSGTPPSPGSGSSLVVVGGYLYYAVGGMSQYWRYNIAENTWARLADAPATWGAGGAQEVVSENIIYAVGVGTPRDTFCRFIIPENRWENLGRLPAAISNANDRLVFDGIFLYMIRAYLDNSFWRYAPAWWENLSPWPGIVGSTVACYAENILSGKRYIYALESKADPAWLYRYDISAGVWENLGTRPGVGIGTAAGSSMVWTGDRYLYVLRGGTTTAPNFFRYDIVENSWTTLAATGTAQLSGSCLAWDGGDNIYAAIRSATPPDNFLKVYRISENRWENLIMLPENAASGSSICRVGNFIYYQVGGATRYWRYSIPDNSWSRLADLPESSSAGGSQERVGDKYIYLVVGGGSRSVYRFVIAENRWEKISDLPATVTNANDRLAFDGTYLYMIRGATDSSFWRYRAAALEPSYSDGARFSYTWLASRSNGTWGFSCPTGSQYIDPAGCSVVENSQTKLYTITFRVRVAKTALPGSWDLAVTVTDKFGLQSELTRTDAVLVGVYLEMSVDKNTLTFSGRQGESVYASESPVKATVTANVSFSLEVRAAGNWTSNGNMMPASATKAKGEGDWVALSTAYQSVWSNISYGEGVERQVEWRLDIPADAVPGNYTNTFYLRVRV